MSHYTDLRLDLPTGAESDLTTQAEVDRAIAEFGEAVPRGLLDLYQSRAQTLQSQCLDVDGRLSMISYRRKLAELLESMQNGG